MRALAAKTLIAMLAFANFVALNAGQALANHVQCGDTITQDTTLDSDLIDCPDFGLWIAADKVTLDLNGHKIDGPGGGIGVIAPSGEKNVTVENGEITQFGLGVATSFGGRFNAVRDVTLSEISFGGAILVGRGSDLERNSVSGTGRFGLWAQQADNATIAGNTVSGGWTGIVVDHSRNAGLERNSVVNGGHGSPIVFPAGVFMFTVQSARIAGNSISGSPTGLFLTSIANEAPSTGNEIDANDLALNDTAITLRGAPKNRVELNSLHRNETGILLIESADNQIEHNSIFDFGGTGIFVRDESSTANTLTRNSVSGQTLGMLVFQAPDTKLSRNVLTANAGDGIRVEAPRALIDDNAANGNGDDGIDVRTAGDTVARNSADQNGDLGIEAVSGVIDGGGNTAFGNGNPLQCLNVVCK